MRKHCAKSSARCRTSGSRWKSGRIRPGSVACSAFLVDATRKRPEAWWREDFRPHFAIINGLPGIIVESPEGPVQTAAFEIEGNVIRALYVVSNPDNCATWRCGSGDEQ
jgi:hypothetical protein